MKGFFDTNDSSPWLSVSRTLTIDLQSVPLDTAGLYRAYAQRVAIWVSRLGGPGFDVEDVVQEVFMHVHQRLSSFRGEAQLTTWLYSITHHVVVSRRRKQRLLRWFGVSDPDAIARAPAVGTPHERLEQRQSAALVYAALDGMAEKYREPLILFEIEGLSGEEIATLTGVKLTTLWVRLNRARNQLLAQVEKLQAKEARGHAR